MARTPAVDPDPLRAQETPVPVTIPGWGLRLRGPHPLVGDLAAVLAPLAIHGERLPRLDVAIDPEMKTARGSVAGGLTWTVPLPDRNRLATLLGQCVGTAVALLRSHLYVHAGAVSWGGRGWVIVGESGMGKTATVALLLRRGARYLSDEIALMDPGHVTLAPFALPMAVKIWTARAVGTLPEGRGLAWDEDVAFHLPAVRQATPVPLEGIVLLTYRRRGAARLLPLSPARMLLALGAHASSLTRADRFEGAFGAFATVLRSVRTFELEAPSPAAGVEALAAFMDRINRPSPSAPLARAASQ